MKFTLVTALLAGAAVAVPTAPIHAHNGTGEALDKRVIDPLSLAIIGGVASAVVAVSATDAVNQIKNVADWTAAREAFTKATVYEMAKSAKPNEASICYNMGYKVSKPNQMRLLTSVRLKSGVLNTDYDCFYMSGPDNHFNTEGDGGYINLAVQNPSSCSFDSKTSDVYCS
ncbi:hypothetical protein ACET3X_006120 [Alternaria dauci]|uniref:DUF7888 domain-containing protein n=1 Tax=Alternaria dauci TaxID=48095 RepID=A0ABR3UHD6_9PLEO